MYAGSITLTHTYVHPYERTGEHRCGLLHPEPWGHGGGGTPPPRGRRVRMRVYFKCNVMASIHIRRSHKIQCLNVYAHICIHMQRHARVRDPSLPAVLRAAHRGLRCLRCPIRRPGVCLLCECAGIHAMDERKDKALYKPDGHHMEMHITHINHQPNNRPAASAGPRSASPAWPSGSTRRPAATLRLSVRHAKIHGYIGICV